MTLDDLHDKIQTCNIGDPIAMLATIDALLIYVGKLEKRIERLESSSKRTADITSCLANGIQPD